MEPKPLSALIPATLASVGRPPEAITVKPPSASWNAKHLKLNTERHPKLKEMELQAGLFCMEMWERPQAGRLLVLAGNNGNGKTHIAKAVSRWVGKYGHEKTWFVEPAKDHRFYLERIYWHWPELLDKLKEGQWDLVDDMMKVPLLVIDELGGGHDPSRVGVDKLCQIMSRRERMWTLITTNVAPTAWEEIFDRRVASRFFRNSTLVDLTEVPDYNA